MIREVLIILDRSYNCRGFFYQLNDHSTELSVLALTQSATNKIPSTWEFLCETIYELNV